VVPANFARWVLDPTIRNELSAVGARR
jgi:hypothetical protein